MAPLDSRVTQKRLVLASNNPGKLEEFKALLAPLGIEAVPQAYFGVEEVDEPHRTFVENALAKARHASVATGLPALADDSGLCVAALGGEPGVHSARYADDCDDRGEQDRRNNAKLIAALAGSSDRRARYVCVLVVVRSAADPEPIVSFGDWHGEIVEVARGSNGFGYDPHFFIPERGLTAAQLSSEEKNRFSHRAIAWRKLGGRLAGDWSMPAYREPGL